MLISMGCQYDGHQYVVDMMLSLRMGRLQHNKMALSVSIRVKFISLRRQVCSESGCTIVAI